MIFSSFGNAPAEMSFIRMAHAIDEFAKESEEDVFVQVGNTRYEFKYARRNETSEYCCSSRWLGYNL